MPSVAVIDIGSNSIKILGVARGENGEFEPQLSETLDARISEGISHANPCLSDEGMRRGLSAIRELIALSIPYDPDQLQLVATSAVRDASNREAFQDATFEATGHRIKILSGTEEANLIGKGITCDPALTDLSDFQLFDLGGGSLECLSFADRQVQRAVSLQIGCVRLTEKFIDDRSSPFIASELQSIYDFSLKIFQEHDWPISAAITTAIGTGGTLATVRAITAEKHNQSFEDCSPILAIEDIRSRRDELAYITLESRQRIPGLPPARADVFPTALTTLMAIAAHGGFSAYHHSHYNLRYGVAAEMLEA